MISKTISSKQPRAKLSAAARIFLVCACLVALGPAASAQTPVTNGFRDFNYGSVVHSAPTGEKPESKLWWNDGFWWASLWNTTAAVYHIYRFDLPTQTWVDTGTPIDARVDSRADAQWDQASQKLYVASHRFLSIGASNTNQANWGRLYRFSYSSATKSYTLDAGFPVNVTRGRSETLTIAKDSTGKLWVTFVEGSTVMVNHSDGNDLTWGTPFVLPVSATATAVTSDDISSIVAFGGSKTGVMWSNQNTGTIYFSVHLDANADNVWQPEEIANPNNACSGPCADDHINLKTDSAGRVYAATKTGQNLPNVPQNMLEVRSTAGTWTGYVFGVGGNNHTRGIVLLDESNNKIYMFATAPETAGVIYYKVTDMNNIAFPVGLGTPFIMSSTETHINDATSTHQNVNSNTGLLVLADDDTALTYLHNYLVIPASNAPVISSFTPLSGAAGTVVTLTGSKFTGATQVAFNTVAATTFTVNSSTQIHATVPAGATTGPISVTTPGGTGTSATDYTITINAAPLLSLVNPTTGTQGQTLDVNLTGQNFVNGVQCGFGVGITVLTCGFTSATQLTAHLTIAGNATVGNRDVTVTNPDTQKATLLNGFSVAQATGGTIALVNKTSGANVTGSSSISLSAAAANHTAGNLLVVICRNGGSLSVTQNPPTDTAGNTYFGLLPVADSNVGRLQMWYAKNILGNPSNVVACHFSSSVPWLSISVLQYLGADPVNPLDAQAIATGGSSSGTVATSAPFSTSQANELIVAGATVDSLGMTYVAGAGFTLQDANIGNISGDEHALVNTLQTNAIATMSWTPGSHHWITVVGAFKATFTPFTTPSISSFNPLNGPVGTNVTLSGSGFTGATAVKFNGTAATTFTVNTDTQITVTVPAGATTGKIAVTNPASTATSAADYAVTTAPLISSFTPANGPAGTSVTLTGTGFTGAIGVAFNGTAATAFTVNTDTQITVTVPVGATTGKISVTNPTATGTSATDFTVIVTPSITSFTPASGPEGSSVTLTGTGFTGATAVKFNGTAATAFTVNTDTQITVAVPAGATTGKISVTNAAGTGTSATDFAVTLTPSITSFTPTNDVVGASVTLTGSRFTGATAVKFNGTAATTFTVNTDTQITVTVPVGATTGKISVTNPTATGTSATDFTVIVTPSITSFTPSNGAIGSTVTLTGLHLTGATAVTFNGTAATTFTVNTDTQITVTVPAGATTGKIAVTNPAGTGTSATDYTVNPPPLLSLANPATGTQGQTLDVNLTGQNFVNGAQCGFGAGITVNSCGFTSATQLTANLTIAGNATVGNRDVTVTNPDTQKATLLNGFSVAQGAGPTIALVNKTSGANVTGSSSTSLSAAAANHTAGNLLVVICRNGGSLSVTQNSPTDTAGNTYFGLLPVTNSNVGRLQMWYAKNILGNPSNVVACHFSSSVPWLSISVLQYSGADPVNPLDAQAIATSGSSSGTTALTAPFSTSQANELIVAAATVDSLGMTYVAGAGFTLEDANIGNISGDEHALVNTLQTNAIATMGWTSGSHHWVIVLATFK